MRDSERVVITGVGAVTALGHSAQETFTALCEGKNGIKKIPALEEAGFPVCIGGAVPNLEALYELYPEAQKYGSRKLAYALKAADEALEMANMSSLGQFECGVYMGVETSRVPFPITYQFYHLSGRQESKVDYHKFGDLCRELYPRQMNHNKLPAFLPRFIANRYKASGPIMATSNACASANYAVGEAIRKLRSGRIKVALTGSADEMLDEYMIIGFSRLKALSFNNAEPDNALKPFDIRRDGFVLGEGGAILVLETLEHAKERKAEILCELGGFGATSDGEKITACHKQGAWLVEAMKRAIEDGQIDLDDLRYVNAHGTSTRLNDLSESRAVTHLFGDKAKEVLVNSTKSMVGHTVAAAGAIEAVVTAMSLANGIFHPTRNFEVPDDGCELNYCQGKAVKRQVEAAISNSCGFSGCNSCLTFKRYHE